MNFESPLKKNFERHEAEKGQGETIEAGEQKEAKKKGKVIEFPGNEKKGEASSEEKEELRELRKVQVDREFSPEERERFLELQAKEK